MQGAIIKPGTLSEFEAKMCMADWHMCLMQVKGNEEIVRLVGTLKPQVVVPLINAGFHASGPLSSIVSERGSNFQLPEKLQQNSMGHVRVEYPAKSGESKDIVLN